MQHVQPGDVAWMLVCTALVLLMTVPGLALFYAGMVRKKNVLAIMMQSFSLCALMSVVWMVAGLFARLHQRRRLDRRPVAGVPQRAWRQLGQGVHAGRRHRQPAADALSRRACS